MCFVNHALSIKILTGVECIFFVIILLFQRGSDSPLAALGPQFIFGSLILIQIVLVILYFVAVAQKRIVLDRSVVIALLASFMMVAQQNLMQ